MSTSGLREIFREGRFSPPDETVSAPVPGSRGLDGRADLRGPSEGAGEESRWLWEQQLVQVSVLKVVRELLEGKFCCHLFNGQKELGLICALQKGQTMNELLALLNQAGRECSQVFALEVTAGLGNPRKNPEELAESYREAKEALEYRVVLGEDRAIYIRDVEPQKRQVLSLSGQEEGNRSMP